MKNKDLRALGQNWRVGTVKGTKKRLIRVGLDYIYTGL